MTGKSEQPNSVSTEDKPAERPATVVTEDGKTPEAADPTAAASDQQAQTTGDSAKPNADKPPAPPRNRAAERRLKKLTKKLAETEGRNTKLEEQVQALAEKVDTLTQAQETADKATPEPDIKDFDTPKDYAKAYQKWEAKQKPAAKPSADDASKPATQPAQSQPVADEKDVIAFKTRGQEKLGDDFVEAVSDKTVLPVNMAMGDFMIDSDLGPELYVYLYNNPEKAASLFKRSETKIRTELTALEARIKKAGTWDLEDEEPAADDDPKDKPTGTKESKAPKPPPEPDRADTSIDVDLETADMEAYHKKRRAQGAHKL